MDFSKSKNFFVVFIIATILTGCTALAFSDNNLISGKIEKLSSIKENVLAVANNIEGIPNQEIILPPPEKLSNPPQIIKAIYATSYSAGSKTYLGYLTGLFKNTQINAVVIDIKGSSGYVAYKSKAQDVVKYNLSNNVIKDIDTLIRFLHDKNIYVIGRISVFEDPVYAKARPRLAVYDKEKTPKLSSGQSDLSKVVLWKDNNGLAWLDPASKEVWDYNISLAKDAYAHGFDEINFDYIRFPTDGKVKNMAFPIYDGKRPIEEVINEFFKYLRENLPEEKISADLFGLTTVNYDDMGIGQLIENAFENFDYVSPMVYPSHYANGFIGFKNPALHPYEVVKYSLDNALIRKNILVKNNLPEKYFGKLRPWLQDFNMGAEYTADLVKAEIKATEDSLGQEYNGFMLWNPSNIYTQGAVLK